MHAEPPFDRLDAVVQIPLECGGPNMKIKEKMKIRCDIKDPNDITARFDLDFNINFYHEPG